MLNENLSEFEKTAKSLEEHVQPVDVAFRLKLPSSIAMALLVMFGAAFCGGSAALSKSPRPAQDRDPVGHLADDENHSGDLKSSDESVRFRGGGARRGRR